MQRQRRAALARPAPRRPPARAGHRERNDLHRRDHVLRRHHGVIGQRADGERFVDEFRRSILAVSTRSRPGASAARLTRPVAARRARRAAARPRASASRSAAMSSGTSPGSSRATITRRGRPHAGRPAAARRAANPCGSCVRRPAGECAMMAPRASSSGNAPNFMPPGFCGTGAPRRTATISAMMDSAISGAVTASMLRPTGPWMRASAASPWPSSRRRLRRAAWVRREPSDADVEGGRFQRAVQRWVVQLRVVGQRHDGGAGVRLAARPALRRASGGHCDVGEALVRGERAARIDHDDGEAAAASRRAPAPGRYAPRRRRSGAAAGCGRAGTSRCRRASPCR